METPKLENLRKAPDNTFLAELASVYKLAIFDSNEIAKKYIDQLDQFCSSLNENEKLYWSLYKATAIDMASGFQKINNRYEMKRRWYEEERDYRAKEIREKTKEKVEYVNDMTKFSTKSGLFGRAALLVSSWLVANFFKSIDALPKKEGAAETIALTVVLGYHIAINKYAERKKIGTIEWYTENIKAISKKFQDKILTIEEEKDLKRKRVIERGEKKIMDAYKKHFEIELDGKFSSEKFDLKQNII